MIDGTLIPVDRVAADRPFYSGKHRKHRMNLQVIASQDGTRHGSIPADARWPQSQVSDRRLARIAPLYTHGW